MQVIFANGTGRQHALFDEALSECTFDFTRIQVSVTVEWTGALPDGHNEFAITVVPGSPADACGKPTTALMRLRDNLDDPSRPGNEGDFPPGTFAGADFYKETVIHELGHVVASHFGPEQIAAVAGAFGGSVSDWPAVSGIVGWADRMQEGQAESFKDIYLPAGDRKFDDRANWHLSSAGFDRYVAMMDTVCPCSPGGAGQFVAVGRSDFFTITHMVLRSNDGHYYARVRGAAHFDIADLAPGQYQPGAAWKVGLPHLSPIARIADGIHFGAPIEDAGNAYFDNGYHPPPPPATPYDDSTFPSFINVEGSIDFQLSDDAGLIGSTSLDLSPGMSDPDDVVLTINPGARMPTSGLAGVDIFVPDGFWFRSAGATIIDTLWRLPNGGPGDEPAYVGSILAPVKSSVPCPPMRRPPYPYEDPSADKEPPGLRLHPRGVFASQSATASPSVTPERAEETRAKLPGRPSTDPSVQVGLSPEQAEAARR